MAFTFRLYILINSKSLHDYPYVALSDDSDLIISICEEHVSIDLLADSDHFYQSDFVATSRTIDVDIDDIFRHAQEYMGTTDCSVTAHYIEYPRVMLAYRQPQPGTFRTHDIYEFDKDETTVWVVQNISGLLDEIRLAAFDGE